MTNNSSKYIKELVGKTVEMMNKNQADSVCLSLQMQQYNDETYYGGTIGFTFYKNDLPIDEITISRSFIEYLQNERLESIFGYERWHDGGDITITKTDAVLTIYPGYVSDVSELVKDVDQSLDISLEDVEDASICMIKVKVCEFPNGDLSSPNWVFTVIDKKDEEDIRRW